MTVYKRKPKRIQKRNHGILEGRKGLWSAKDKPNLESAGLQSLNKGKLNQYVLNYVILW